jgi:DNA invertase Pin-like site-specific DNA recombinase
MSWMSGLKHGDKVRAGMARARAQGKHIGRPRKDDGVLGDALAGFVTGKLSQYEAAKLAGLPRSTFRRRMIELNAFPSDANSHT